MRVSSQGSECPYVAHTVAGDGFWMDGGRAEHAIGRSLHPWSLGTGGGSYSGGGGLSLASGEVLSATGFQVTRSNIVAISNLARVQMPDTSLSRGPPIPSVMCAPNLFFCARTHTAARRRFRVARVDYEELIPMLVGPLMRTPRPYGD